MSDPSTQSALAYSIGHSNRSEEDFLELLARFGIQELVDVRRFPGSRRFPRFGSDQLRDTLAEMGVGYLHLSELGGRRGKPMPDSPNTGWRVAAFQAYADWMNDPGWIASLETLATRCRELTVAFMCAEAVPWRCHRRLISDALLIRGIEVLHIVGPGRAYPHALPEFARVLPSQRIIYPPQQTDGRKAALPNGRQAL